MRHQILTAGRYLSILFLCFFFSEQTFSQNIIGRQRVDQFPSDPWGGQMHGLTWLPDDYFSTNQSYPLIIFLHGSGEAGSGEWGLHNLLRTALPQKIANGWDPQAVNPVDGRNYKFIVVSPQAPVWSANFQQLSSVIPAILAKYRVDLSRVYVTGLSAGGAGTWATVTNGYDFAQKITAVVPVAAASTNSPGEEQQMHLVGGTYGVKVWQLCGTGDSFWVPANRFHNLINGANPPPQVPAVLSGIPGGHEHHVWNTFYDAGWRDNSQNSNIYEWMLRYTRSNGPAPIPVPVPVPVVPTTLPGRVEAESHSSQNGTQTETTADAGGGQNVGWIDQNDWMDYSVNPTVSGNYTVSFRVASAVAGGQLQLRNSSGTALATVAVPNTGGWQTWQTVTANVNLSSGTQTLRVVSTAASSWNINWLNFIQAPVPAPLPVAHINIPGRVEAENYMAMSGVQNENTADAGGGQNVGYIDNGDWMDYSVNAASAGVYNVSIRLASSMSGGQLQIRNSNGTALATVSVPNTGGWQNWQTATAAINLPLGIQTLRVVSTSGASWNINWMDLAQSGPITDPAPAPAPTPTPATQRIEAERYSAMSGVGTENTTDAGGGQNIGWIDQNDWMDYSVNIATAGTYTFNIRVASSMDGGQLQFRNSAGVALATLNVPNTNGWQNWQTITATMTLPAGTQTLRLVSVAWASWNINWFEISGNSTPSVPADFTLKVEAESFTGQNGIGTEYTSDAGGGQNVGWVDNGDWMDYSVNIPAAGTYTLNFRIASSMTGGTIQVRAANGSILATLNVPNTNGWQNWQTISTTATLAAGAQTIRLQSNATASWNINWFEITSTPAARLAVQSTATEASTTGFGEVSASSLSLYPNPVTDRVVVQLNNAHQGAVQIQVISLQGAVVKTFAMQKTTTGTQQFYLSVGDLPAGNYIVRTVMAEETKSTQMIKQ